MVGQVGVGGEFSTVTATTMESTKVDVRALANDVKVILGKTEQTSVFPKEQVEKIVSGMNDFLKASPHTNLKFEFHEELNEYYVTIVDDITNEVIKEIPPKKMLDMFAAMTEFLGLMVDKKI